MEPEKHITDEKGISYTLCGNCYLPDLALPEEEYYELGRFGRVLCPNPARNIGEALQAERKNAMKETSLLKMKNAERICRSSIFKAVFRWRISVKTAEKFDRQAVCRRKWFHLRKGWRLQYDFHANDLRLDDLVEKGYDVLLVDAAIPDCIAQSTASKTSVSKNAIQGQAV